MTELIFMTTPWLLVFPICAMLLSAVCAILSRFPILSYINGILHAFAVALMFLFGGDLTDVFLTLMLSLTVSVLIGVIKSARAKNAGGDGQ